MATINKHISPFIESQVPAFYLQEGETFVQFLKAYYEWLESADQPLYKARSLLEYNDIDQTLDAFVPYFVKKYLKDFDFVGIEQKRDLVKRSKDIYRSKGTVQCLRLIFQLLFEEEIDVYIPGTDIFRSSDALWYKPVYLEVTRSDRNKTFVGEVITGSRTGSRAFVEGLSTRMYKGKQIDVLRITQLTGDFETGERVNDDGIIANSPSVTGSLTTIELTDPGGDWTVGQEVDIISDRKGKGGKLKVDSISKATGFINYVIEDGGFGTSLHANVFGSTQKVFISNTVFIARDIYQSNTDNSDELKPFDLFSGVSQPLSNVIHTSANVTFQVNDFVYGGSNTTNFIAGGFVVKKQDSSNNIVINIHDSTNTVFTVDSGANTTGSFNVGEYVYQTNGTGNTFVGMVVDANSTYSLLANKYGTVDDAKTLIGLSSNCYANVTSHITVDRSQDFTNTSITTLIVGGTSNGATLSTATDATATANTIDSNSSAFGIFNGNGTFYVTGNTMVVDSVTGAQATPFFKSSGDPGTFFIGGLTNKEQVTITTDTLSQNNDSGVAYMNVALSATRYGMQGWGNGNINSVIYHALGRQQIQVGEIISLAGIYRGQNNDTAPFVKVVEPVIAKHQKFERMYFSVTNRTGSFKEGENLIQTFIRPSVTCTFSGSSGIMNELEIVKQVRSDGNTVHGEVLREVNAGGSGQITITIANSSASFDTSNTIVGLTSGETISTVSAVVANTYEVRAKATLVSANNTTNLLTVDRNSFNDFKGEPAPILRGESSGTTANLMSVSFDSTSKVIGNNAVISANASITNNTIAQLTITSSGVGYELDEVVRIPNPNYPEKSAYGTVSLNRQGIGAGYWKEDNSTTSGIKRLHDNHYYQEFSYEVRSGVDSSQYRDIINETVHVAGTRMIPAFQKVELNDTKPVLERHDYASDRTIKLDLTSRSGEFTIGANLTQGNTSGIIVSFSNTLNRIEVANVSGSFVDSVTVTDGTATANVSSTELVFL